MKRKFLNAIGIAVFTIIIMGSLIVVRVQLNEQDPPGLGVVGLNTNK